MKSRPYQGSRAPSSELASIPPVPLGPDAVAEDAATESDAAFVVRVGLHTAKIRPLVEHAVRGSGAIREKEFVEITGLERSLARRVFQLAEESEDLSFMHRLPSPAGLRLVLVACQERGLIAPAAVADAEKSIDGLESFLSSYPGKRSALLTRLSAMIPEERDSKYRAARRAMFKSASEILGYRVREAAVASLIVDGDDPVRFDVYHLAAKYGLERISRAGQPIIVGSQRNGPDGPRSGFLPLDANTDPSDPRSALLTEFCSGPASVRFVQRGGGLIETQLSEADPPIHEPVDVVTAQRAPGSLRRFAGDGYSHEWRRVISRIPAENLTIDLILAPGVYDEIEVVVSEQLYRSEVPPFPCSDSRRTEQLPTATTVKYLEPGLLQAGLTDCPRYVDGLRRLTAAAGVDENSCRVIRVTKGYPELNSDVMCWISLPQAGESRE